ncbi:MAG: hypothetical protein BroJett017_27880 [Ignavibacteriota bacterium]|nr:MAG: hypothetical protein BroJett017_27880 [Ignavibacteriota bacterium]
MPYKLNKIILQRDNIRDFETHTHPMDTEIDFPFVAGKLQELVPIEHQYGKKSKLELSTTPLFNESSLTKLIPEIGPKGIYYLELRPGYKLKQLMVDPDEVIVDIFIGPIDTLIYSFYNPTRRNSISITASIEKDSQVYPKLKSDLSDIHWRQYFIRLAMDRVQEKEIENKVSANMNAKEVADYLGVGTKTIRNWTSEGKIPSVKIGSAVRYPKERIDNWVKTKEKKSTRKRATK